MEETKQTNSKPKTFRETKVTLRCELEVIFRSKTALDLILSKVDYSESYAKGIVNPCFYFSWRLSEALERKFQEKYLSRDNNKDDEIIIEVGLEEFLTEKQALELMIGNVENVKINKEDFVSVMRLLEMMSEALQTSLINEECRSE